MTAATILNLFFCRFWSNGLLAVAAGYITATFHSFTSIGGRGIAVCTKILRWRVPPSWIYFLFNILAYLHVALQFHTHAKFWTNMCNSKRVMSDRCNLKFRPPPSSIYFFLDFGQMAISNNNWLHHCKISFIYVNRWPRYCCLCKNSK